ncbi:hypothetical protein BV20DRAFT_242788 [Pilatotrama ljubarskyi]|nr:hypothetical protein BV20DRAFT_242788 [Pilatotrama ljubarskyi]
MPRYCTHAVRILPRFRAVQHVFRIITFLRGYSKILIMLYRGSSAHSISAAARSCLVSGHAPGHLRPLMVQRTRTQMERGQTECYFHHVMYVIL